MSASSPEDQTKCAPGGSLFAVLHQQFVKDESSIDRSMDVCCSIEAAQRGLRHVAMNRNGLYRPRGMVQVLENGTMQWREKENKRWCNAVKYEDIRGKLLVECAELGQYTYPREKGELAEDITAFHPDQKDWVFQERHLRPDILHQYEKRGYHDPCYPVQIWLYQGAVVLDNRNQPILDFKNMPKAISSQVEGGLQEAIIRQDSRIEAKDFRVRMLLDPKGQGGANPTTPGLSAISMRRSRFRWKAGYLSWTTRTGTDDLKKYIDSILPAHCKAANSTRDFRELKPSEVKKMTLENRGKYLSRAGNRLLSPEARKRAEENFKLGLRRAEIRDGFPVQELEEEGEEQSEMRDGFPVQELEEEGEEQAEMRDDFPVQELEEEGEEQAEMRDGFPVQELEEQGEQGEEEERTGSPTKADRLLRPTWAHPRQWLRDMSDQEQEEHRKRILKIFAPHRESCWNELDGVDQFAVDWWDDLAAVGAITYDDGKKEPALNYEVIRELIKHVLDGKRVSEFHLFQRYDKHVAGLYELWYKISVNL